MEPFRIKQAEFVTSMTSLSQFPEKRLIEIAFAGKSNVGKSSLINAIANNKKLAKTSSKPGKTRFVNYFLINNDFYWVDLPGYGYARAAKTEQENWSNLVEEYLSTTDKLKHMFFLVDIRHNPTQEDVQMCNWLKYYQVPFTVVATKCDKIAKSKQVNYTRIIKNKLELDSDTKIIPVSVLSRIGCDRVIQTMGDVVNILLD